jgi:MoxR-like ATPase
VSAEFTGVVDVRDRLTEAGYLVDPSIETVVYLAERLGKPILVEGPAGVGKTELAKAVATARDANLVRLQCYEGLDEAKALYEWNYKKQLLRIQADADQVDWHQVEQDIFTEDFLLSRPLLTAIRSSGPVVLLIDEIDRLEVETEALLLEVLSDWQVSIPELGTVRASNLPFAVLTSNNTRELSEALKRRCLFLPMTYPTVEREREIILARVPGIDARFAEQIARVVRTIRGFDLKKAPSVSETLDWTRTLMLLGQDRVDEGVAVETLPLLLKYQHDIDLVRAEFEGNKP